MPFSSLLGDGSPIIVGLSRGRRKKTPQKNMSLVGIEPMSRHSRRSRFTDWTTEAQGPVDGELFFFFSWNQLRVAATAFLSWAFFVSFIIGFVHTW